MSVRKAVAVGPMIEGAVAAGDWPEVESLAARALADSPDDHWLMARTALSLYERGDYAAALDWSGRSLSVSPNCPLAMWERAGALDMLGRESEAVGVYHAIIRAAGGRDLDECGEGPAWAAALTVDCLYRAGCCLVDIGRAVEGVGHLGAFLVARESVRGSIYTQDDAMREMRRADPTDETVFKAADAALALIPRKRRRRA